MAENIRIGNIKLLLCFAFYLAWWIVGFNPWRPIRGPKSGWLLIPAIILGALALVDIAQGIDLSDGLMSGRILVVGGIASYVALLFITSGPLNRPVTSELLIIVLWATVALLEVNTLVALGSIAPTAILEPVQLAGTTVSLVCYQLFYGLNGLAAFVDGPLPLVLAGLMTGLIALCTR